MKEEKDSSRPDAEMPGNDQTEFNGRPLTNRRPQRLSTRIESETLDEGRCNEENVKVKALLDRTVDALNAEARRDARSWLTMGKLVTDYVERNKQAKDDAFRRLADHPAMALQAGQLRNYHAAYLLWMKIGQSGVPPEVSHTKFVAVLGCNLNFGDKLTLLQRAEKEGWSVSRLKKAIKDRLNGGESSNASGEQGRSGDAAPIDCNVACSRLSDLAAKTMAQTTFVLSSFKSPVLSADAKENLQGLVRLLVVNLLLERKFFEELFSATKGGSK